MPCGNTKLAADTLPALRRLTGRRRHRERPQRSNGAGLTRCANMNSTRIREPCRIRRSTRTTEAEIIRRRGRTRRLRHIKMRSTQRRKREMAWLFPGRFRSRNTAGRLACRRSTGRTRIICAAWRQRRGGRSGRWRCRDRAHCWPAGLRRPRSRCGRMWMRRTGVQKRRRPCSGIRCAGCGGRRRSWTSRSRRWRSNRRTRISPGPGFRKMGRA